MEEASHHPKNPCETMMFRFLIQVIPIVLLYTGCTQSNIGKLRGYIISGDTNQLSRFAFLTTNVNMRLRAGTAPGAYETPLILAIRYGQYDVVTLLLKMGAEPNLPDYQGKTPLRAAVSLTCDGVNEDCRVKMIRLLLNNGAKVDQKDMHGDAALAWAIILEHPRITKELIQAGADVNVRDKYRNTPLHLARDLATAELLVNAGADLTATNIRGDTPGTEQSKEGRWDILTLLTNSTKSK